MVTFPLTPPIVTITISQRAMVAAKLATFDQGHPEKKAPIGTIKINEAAQSLNVGKRSVQRARRIIENGTPEVQAAVDRLGGPGTQLGVIQ